LVRFRDVVRAALAVVLLSSASAPVTAGETDGPAQVVRTSESRFVHRIKLKDEEAEPITAESTVPYSPRKTCGIHGCHSYGDICKGTHTLMYPGDKFNAQRPPAHVWTMFDPATGMQGPLAYGFLASEGQDPAESGLMTAFAFVTNFGAFHPGGGRLELDGQGERYDKRMAEDVRLRLTLNPDYFQSRWDQSGVLENDCLLCHSLSLYDHAERATQISVMNFKWAPTVGAGFGIVSGQVSAMPLSSPGGSGGDAGNGGPKVKYNPALFDAEGRVYLEIGRPPDRNCLFCHRRPAKERASWRDCLDADVHSLSGLKCVDCHRCGTDHIIAGDHGAAARHALDAEYSTLTCEGCHETGRLGSPVPRHRGLPRLHLKKISCEVCHSGPRPRPEPLMFEQPTDPVWGCVAGRRKPSGPTIWAPVFARHGTRRLHNFTRLLPQWYARRTDKGLEPLSQRGLVPVFFRAAAKGITDDNGDGVPEVNKDIEIVTILQELGRKVEHPVYLDGGLLYELDDNGQLTTSPNPLAAPIDRPMAHNVRPAHQSLGADGCMDCHRSDSPFFMSLGPVRAMGNRGKPEGEPMFARLGMTGFGVQLGAFRERYLRPYATWIILVFIVLLALHYIVIGPRRPEREETEEYVQRFGKLERLGHFTLLLSFFVLAVTGFLLISGRERIFGIKAKELHEVFSTLLVAGAAGVALLWSRDMVFRRLDKGWFKVLGGYLGYRGRVPAGRFNAGQKVLFWLVCALVGCLALTGWVMMAGRPEFLLSICYTLHILCMYVVILLVIGHVYLGVFANPGTLRAMLEGRVDKAWLEHHHPDHEPEDEKNS